MEEQEHDINFVSQEEMRKELQRSGKLTLQAFLYFCIFHFLMKMKNDL